MSRPKVLFITTQLPYPPKSGGTVKSWKYVSFLAKNYSLSVASLLKDDDADHVTAFKEQLELDQFIAEELHLKRSIGNLLKSYLKAPCLNAYRNASSSFKRNVEAIIPAQEIIIVDHYEMFQYIPTTFNGTLVMHTHNAEFMLWQRMGELEPQLVKKLILLFEAKRVKKYERYIFQHADLIYATPSDILLYKAHGFDSHKLSKTYHLGNDQLLDLPPILFNHTEKALTFIGTLSWEPNIDGIVWFLKKVWPLILSHHPDTKLYILGKNADQRIIDAANGNSSVIFTGFIKDLESYLKKTRVYIAPLRFGSGMKVKVLEGLYRGVPTVSTAVGAEGLEVSSGESIFIADDPSLFAKHCIQLIEEEELWQKISTNGRLVAKKLYRWAPLFEEMNASLLRTKKK